MDQPISLDTVIEFLVATPIFDSLDAVERAEVVRVMNVQRLSDGECVFRERDPGDAWYVIFEGRAEVVREISVGTERRIALLAGGACFGEMAILDGSTRSATVRAAGPLTLFRFGRPAFEELLGDGSLAAYKLVAAVSRVLSQRLRLLNQQVSDLMDGQLPAAPAVRSAITGLVDRNTVSE